jgi:hypothetical protein
MVFLYVSVLIFFLLFRGKKITLIRFIFFAVLSFPGD